MLVRGCFPSKTLICPGDALAAARRTPGAAQAITGPINAAAAVARVCAVGLTENKPVTRDSRSDQLHSATIAIVGPASLEQLSHEVPAFPTVSKVWLHLLEAYGL